jgi:hypothetical protein
MDNEAPTNDPMNIWQNQPTEPPPMTLEEIRRKARALQAKSRREFLGNLTASLSLIAFSAWSFATSQDAIQRSGFALAIAWFLIAQYPAHKRLWSSKLAGDAALTTGVQFYRGELERRRDHFRYNWQWVLGPILLMIGSLLLPALRSVLKNPGLTRNMVPFVALLAVWIAAFFVIRNRAIREVKQEIDELNALERNNQ